MVLEGVSEKMITVKMGIASGLPLALVTWLDGFNWAVFLAAIPAIATTIAALTRAYTDWARHRREERKAGGE